MQGRPVAAKASSTGPDRDTQGTTASAIFADRILNLCFALGVRSHVPFGGASRSNRLATAA